MVEHSLVLLEVVYVTGHQERDLKNLEEAVEVSHPREELNARWVHSQDPLGSP